MGCAVQRPLLICAVLGLKRPGTPYAEHVSGVPLRAVALRKKSGSFAPNGHQIRRGISDDGKALRRWHIKNAKYTGYELRTARTFAWRFLFFPNRLLRKKKEELAVLEPKNPRLLMHTPAIAIAPPPARQSRELYRRGSSGARGGGVPNPGEQLALRLITQVPSPGPVVAPAGTPPQFISMDAMGNSGGTSGTTAPGRIPPRTAPRRAGPSLVGGENKL
jgi:hypothetical protein